MHTLELLLRGVLAGLAISIPVGPVNIFCIQRTLLKGRLTGIIAGFGAAAADTIYGSVAGFSISFIIGFLVRQLFWIRLVGGAVLILIGVVYFFKRPKSLAEERAQKDSRHSDFAAAFLLTLTNPTTVLSFLAVLAGLHLEEGRPWYLTMLVVAGIFTGAMTWWVVLSLGANHFRDRFNDNAVCWMNRIAGMAIGGFGLLTMLLAHNAPRPGAHH
jgi:threonine/homoserine/homoserine lactone efflux protein